MFSIIMPAYNEERNIKEAVESVLNQSFKDIELIVVDDGSTDNTWEILKNIQKYDQRLKIFHPGKLGKNGAINYAKKHVEGDWFAFLAADDIMEPNILNKWFAITQTLNPISEEIVIASRIRMFTNDDKFDSFSGIEIPKNKNDVCHSGAAFLASKKLMNNLFPFPEEFPNEDGWTSLYFKYLTERFIPCPEIYVNYRIHDGNSLNKKASFIEFNEKYHERSIVKQKFVDIFKERLTTDQVFEIMEDLKAEYYRYNGSFFKILFLYNNNFFNKIRLLVLSNSVLYALKLKLNKYLLGRAS